MGTERRDEPIALAADSRLGRQLSFLREIDKLKLVLRRTYVMDASRLENTAEHSWHIAVMAMALLEYADEPDIDVNRVIRLMLVHDIVEIDAGDTFAYDSSGYADKDARERAAADRLFGLLPDDQREEWIALWREFEDGATPEARFAAALDRLQPVLQNYYTGGVSWRDNGIRKDQVIERLRPLESSSSRLWAYLLSLLDEAVGQGLLLPAADAE